MADYFWAHGTTLEFDSANVSGLVAVGIPDQSKEEVEVTHHGSGGWRQFVPGLRDGGTCAINCRIKTGDAGQQALYANFGQDGVNAPVIISLPADPENADFVERYTFSAYVSRVGGNLPFDGAGERTYELRITGEVQTESVSV